MAERFHLFPYRTQKLSFLTPKVLAGTLAGRIGHRHFSFKELLRFSQWLFSFLSFSPPTQPVSHAYFFLRACLTLPARMVYNWIEGNGKMVYLTTAGKLWVNIGLIVLSILIGGLVFWLPYLKKRKSVSLRLFFAENRLLFYTCLLYTSDAADE